MSEAQRRDRTAGTGPSPGRAAGPDGAPGPTGGSTRPRVLYLGGLGRSGTTVLERMLGEVDGIRSVGELVHLWQRGVLDDETCGCGRPFSRCPFWIDVGARAFGTWDQALARRMLELRTRVDRTRHVARLAAPRPLSGRTDELDEYVSTFLRLYEGIRDASGGAVVLDSSKHPSLAFCLRTDTRIDLRVVHVVRDSRGVAYSWTKEVRRPESGSGETYMTRYSPTRSALLWDSHNLCLALLRRLGTPTRLLRYEDLVAAPRAALEDLLRFADVPTGPDALRFLHGDHARLTPGHTVSGNPMRFRTGSVVLRRDDEWRRQLHPRHQQVTSALTLPLLVHYGYLRRTRPSSVPAGSPEDRPT